MLRHLIRNYLEPKALVLMYHRVAEPDGDIWDLSVSPSNFDEQLQVLKESGEVVPLHELSERLKSTRPRKRYIAISFDDGYLDNYEAAKPLLEKHQLPATFFVTTCNLGKDQEFWWDELEHLILYSSHLPPCFEMKVNDKIINKNLNEESELTAPVRQKNRNWKAGTQAPPSRRAELYLELWATLKVLPDTTIQQLMVRVREWAGSDTEARAAYKSVSADQVHEMAQHPLFTIGAHTATHPALGHHSFAYQQAEIMNNKELLHSITGKGISLLAYPYGNYNKDSVRAAATSFDAAFTTEGRAVRKHTPKHCMGRFQVSNVQGIEFDQRLREWAKM